MGADDGAVNSTHRQHTPRFVTVGLFLTTPDRIDVLHHRFAQDVACLNVSGGSEHNRLGSRFFRIGVQSKIPASMDQQPSRAGARPSMGREGALCGIYALYIWGSHNLGF